MFIQHMVFFMCFFNKMPLFHIRIISEYKEDKVLSNFSLSFSEFRLICRITLYSVLSFTSRTYMPWHVVLPFRISIAFHSIIILKFVHYWALLKVIYKVMNPKLG